MMSSIGSGVYVNRVSFEHADGILLTVGMQIIHLFVHHEIIDPCICHFLLFDSHIGGSLSNVIHF